MKEVDILTLKEHYPSEFQDHYEKWAYGQHDMIGELLVEDVPEYAEQELDGTGWSVANDIRWRVDHCQGDGVGIEACVYLDKMSEETLDELRKDFPMCLELLSRDYFDVYSRLSSRRDNISVIGWDFHVIQETEDDEEYDGRVERLEGGLYDGLPESVAYQAAEAEGIERFIDDLGDRLKDAEQRVYRRIVDEIKFQTSEEQFIEWALDFEEMFEVEEDEEVEA